MATDKHEVLEIQEHIITELENAYQEIFDVTIEIGDDIVFLSKGLESLQKIQPQDSNRWPLCDIIKFAKKTSCGEETYYRLLYILERTTYKITSISLLNNITHSFLSRRIHACDFSLINNYFDTKHKAPVAPAITMDSCITFLKSLQKEMETMKKENKKLMQENADLKADVKDLKDGLAEANKMMKKVKTEDEFVVRIVELAKENCVGSPDDAKPYATMLKELGRSKEAAELRQWIKEEKKAMQQVNIEKVNDIHDNDNVTAKLM